MVDIATLDGTSPAGRVDELGPVARHVLQCTGKGETGINGPNISTTLNNYKHRQCKVL